MARDPAGTGAALVGPRNWGSPFAQGCLACMCDATVRMFPYSVATPASQVNSNGTSNLGTSAPGLAGFLTPAGGETVTLPDT